jgi:ribA/ribD-fused uncharacterized protein
MQSINGFFGKYAFLSNFYPTLVLIDGIQFPSSEHAYIAQKTRDIEIRNYIVTLSAKEAKKFGRAIPLVENWNEKRIDAMWKVLLVKFSNTQLRGRLLATGNSQLVETNHWHDYFWGECNGKGENWLGRLLMGVRDYYT